MDDEGVLGKILPVLQENKLAASVGGIGLLALGYGLSSSFTPASEPEIVIQEEAQEASTGKVMIDISGAVFKPGVYEVDSNARIQDVVLAAGGMVSEADTGYIAKNLNLAQKVNDGEKIYIPFVSDQKTAGVESLEDGKISINSATATELESLPGIGPVTAEKIISNRPYSSVDDLLNKKSVGQAVFEDIKSQISL